MKVLLIDDEPLARDGLRLLLDNETDVVVIAECADGNAAVTAITEYRPDLVFLDINMPGLNGLDVVRAVGVEHMPLVIFLTAYDQHAIEAFTLHALDYLLKPVSDARFCASLQRARDHMQKRDDSVQQKRLAQLLQQLSAKTPGGTDERIMIRTTGHVFFLKPAEITWVEADGDYVSIHTPAKTHLVRETLKHMEEKLKVQGFQRIHRGSVVNLAAIRELLTSDSGDYDVILHDSTRLKLSRAYRDELMQRLQNSVQGSYR